MFGGSTWAGYQSKKDIKVHHSKRHQTVITIRGVWLVHQKPMGEQRMESISARFGPSAANIRKNFMKLSGLNKASISRRTPGDVAVDWSCLDFPLSWEEEGGGGGRRRWGRGGREGSARAKLFIWAWHHGLVGLGFRQIRQMNRELHPEAGVSLGSSRGHYPMTKL